MAEYNPSKIIKDGNTYNFRDTTKIPLAGSNAISGSLIPSTDNSIDIGSSTKNIKMLYTKGITIDGKTVDTDANGNMTFDSHKVDTIEEQGNGYIRYSNGLQICWGNADSDIVAWVNLLFPKPFKDTMIYMTTSQVYASNDRDNFKNASVGVVVSSNTTFSISVYNSSLWSVNYYAIGNWK